MERRDFLATSASLAASLAALASGEGCGPALPSGAPAASAPSTSPSFAHPDLEEATIAQLAARLARGELTSRQLVARYIERVEAIDRAGPTLRSVLELNPDADAIAAQLDEERRAKGPRGPLHGIPILLKDNIDTGDRMQTTAGSLALLGTRARTDSGVAARLRAAGAILLGKTNLSEWANIRSTHSTSGWSGRGGLTRNPYALDRNASGSSSGSAAAVSSSLAAAALGSETDGSIVSPSSICGIVGLKPTVGLLSGAGIIPISHSQDTAGPMARTVADVTILLGALADRDYTKSLDAGGLKGARLGVMRDDAFHVSSAVMAVFDAAVADLQRLGASTSPVTIPHLAEVGDAETEVLSFELKTDIAAYLATRGVPGLASLEDLVAFNKQHAADELRWFGQEFFEKALTRGGLDTPAYLEALAKCRRLMRDEGIDALLSAHELDAIVAPTGGPAWMTDLVNGDGDTGGSSTPAAVAGYPSITVPAGFVHGLPVGVSFFAGANAEAMLLRLAFAYEQATRHRRAPRYLTTISGSEPT
jgi:amidase